ncbi:unnamed protein product [Didymodactylos carnosus]|uniref:CCHC-type domain-containing protein n=2 Tax=Didymodactylos carnosus TaxID=1234261 RepID=A0A814PA01_9BILA|nr:unnamed protein product [Didymodactylos carnosus]CAF3869426.1 unnamed protein product [Didymodactylos carnosus]
MAGPIRRSLGPVKKRLKDILEDKPKLLTKFSAEAERDGHLQTLIAYRMKLEQSYTSYLGMKEKLLDIATNDDAECKRLETEADEHGEIVIAFDDIKADISTAIELISKQQKDDTDARYRKYQIDGELKLKEKSIELAVERESIHNTKTGSTTSTNVKLPRLDLIKFNGDVMKWQEFWDSFSSAVHDNRSLQPVEKMNYLKAQLDGEAKNAIMGLALTNETYDIAVRLLKERFGQTQTVINAHYSALMDLAPAPDQTYKLRRVVDAIECHLHALKALDEDINHRHFGSLIMSKLPKEVVFHLEENRGNENWDVEKVRERLRYFVSARETAERQLLASSTNKTKNESKNETSTKTSPHRSTTETLFTTASGKVLEQKCIYCERKHWSDECRTFATIEARKKKIKGCCFICLKRGHQVRECRRDQRCIYCKKVKDHHRSLCPSKFASNEKTESAYVATDHVEEVTTTTQATLENSLLASGEYVLLQTATTIVQNATVDKNSISARLILDCGSQRSYISEALVNKLGLKTISKETLSVFTFGATQPTKMETSMVELKIKLLDGRFFNLSANVVPKIRGNIQQSPVDIKKFGILYEQLPLADSISKKVENKLVDLLIGNDYYWDIITSEKIELAPGLYLIGSKLGRIISGRHRGPDWMKKLPSTVLFTYSQPCQMAKLPFVPADTQLADKFDFKHLWDLETIGIKDRIDDTSDENALQVFNDTIHYKNKRYYVKWPWKDPDVILPTNYQLSLGRLKSQLRRYKDQPQFFAQYHAVINTQLEKGIIEKVDDQFNTETKKHYIPHHAVITPDKSTTKLRIVYDGSAKSKKENKSINECLHRGPVMLEDVCQLLIRFRLNEIAMVADIEKAFLQVGLQDADRDVTRFLWLKDPTILTSDNNLQIYRFTRVPFGIISSPFLLAATITYHLRKDGSDIASNILKNIYVDNIITGTDSVDQAIIFYEKTKELFKTASMNVCEWTSNSEKLIDYLPAHDRTHGTVTKVLGIPWNTELDLLSISTSANPTEFEIITKRTVIKFIASIFDPLGLFCPAVLPAKLFLQQLWVDKLDWDDALSSAQSIEWNFILTQIRPISNLSFPRFIGLTAANVAIKYELHCFCDASQKAYGTCVYLRCITDTSILTNLLFAKSRLAPTKIITMPRLELLAVHIGSRCLKFVADSLPFPVDEKYLWTDSQCVLHWLHSTKTLSVFVTNRITDIKKFSNVNYRYVSTDCNPADLASRGKSATELFTLEIWWHGPHWLAGGDHAWPSMSFLSKSVDATVIDQITSEEKVLKVFFETSVLAPEVTGADLGSFTMPFEIDQTRYSSLTKLIRITAWCMRFINRLKQNKVTSKYLASEELEQSKDVWIKFVQKKYFSSVLLAIERNQRHPLTEQLGLWLDKNGILRCGGRLVNAKLSENAMFPKLLPKKDYFTTLIIQNYHQKLLHVGVAHTLAQIRNEFWIPSGRSEVFKIVKRCLRCKKFDGGPYKMPEMPALPKARVSESAPFTFTGLDYLGPLYIKENGRTTTKKVWICLFTCLSTRAIHLELVDDMSADQFLLCLRRFIARRVYVGADFASGYVLTPAHFLSLNYKVGTPATEITELQDEEYIQNITSKDRLLQNWKRGQRHIEQFWTVWRNDYLLNLRERTQRFLRQPHCRSIEIPKVGDVVHVRNDGPRGSWQLARVIKIIKSSDEQVRSAKVILLSGTVLTRALMHLYPLECDEKFDIIDEPTEINVDKNECLVQHRPIRKAAEKASAKMQQLALQELSD